MEYADTKRSEKNGLSTTRITAGRRLAVEILIMGIAYEILKWNSRLIVATDNAIFSNSSTLPNPNPSPNPNPDLSLCLAVSEIKN